MATRGIILVDQDNVIADQLSHFHALLARDHPEIWQTYRGETTSYEIEADFALEHAEAIKTLRRTEGFFRDLAMIPGAKNGLNALTNAGFDVRICTAPIWQFEFCVPEKLAWIAREIGHEWAANTIIARDKTLIAGDILIDDKPEITGAREGVWTHVLYDQPYNRSTEKPRVSWGDIPALIETITQHLR